MAVLSFYLHEFFVKGPKKTKKNPKFQFERLKFGIWFFRVIYFTGICHSNRRFPESWV